MSSSPAHPRLLVPLRLTECVLPRLPAGWAPTAARMWTTASGNNAGAHVMMCDTPRLMSKLHSARPISRPRRRPPRQNVFSLQITFCDHAVAGPMTPPAFLHFLSVPTPPFEGSPGPCRPARLRCCDVLNVLQQDAAKDGRRMPGTDGTMGCTRLPPVTLPVSCYSGQTTAAPLFDRP